jgi:hypothetical protein
MKFLKQLLMCTTILLLYNITFQPVNLAFASKLYSKNKSYLVNNLHSQNDTLHNEGTILYQELQVANKHFEKFSYQSALSKYSKAYELTNSQFLKKKIYKKIQLTQNFLNLMNEISMSYQSTCNSNIRKSIQEKINRFIATKSKELNYESMKHSAYLYSFNWYHLAKCRNFQNRTKDAIENYKFALEFSKRANAQKHIDLIVKELQSLRTDQIPTKKLTFQKHEDSIKLPKKIDKDNNNKYYSQKQSVVDTGTLPNKKNEPEIEHKSLFKEAVDLLHNFHYKDAVGQFEKLDQKDYENLSRELLQLEEKESKNIQNAIKGLQQKYRKIFDNNQARSHRRHLRFVFQLRNAQKFYKQGNIKKAKFFMEAADFLAETSYEKEQLNDIENQESGQEAYE